MAAPLVSGMAALCYNIGECDSQRGSSAGTLYTSIFAASRAARDQGFEGDPNSPVTCSGRAVTRAMCTAILPERGWGCSLGRAPLKQADSCPCPCMRLLRRVHTRRCPDWLHP